jgi:glycosyltransferase involved in cell wall biosynthesis
MVRVAAIVPARDEADRIASTVRGLAGLPDIEEILVVDDGSTDGTGEAALAAGARVIRSPRSRGKGGALEAGLRAAAPASVYLFADGDLGDSASGVGSVLREVLDGRSDLAIAVVPRSAVRGLGIVKRSAAAAIRLLSGFRATEPLSGQRAMTAAVLERCRPLAAGFGVEVGMTIDAVRAGFLVREVDADVSHRPTGRNLRGFVHRGRQGVHVLRAVATRAARPAR